MATESQHKKKIIDELFSADKNFNTKDAVDSWLVKELASTRARLDILEKRINVKKI